MGRERVGRPARERAALKAVFWLGNSGIGYATNTSVARAMGLVPSTYTMSVLRRLVSYGEISVKQVDRPQGGIVNQFNVIIKF